MRKLIFFFLSNDVKFITASKKIVTRIVDDTDMKCVSDVEFDIKIEFHSFFIISPPAALEINNLTLNFISFSGIANCFKEEATHHSCNHFMPQ